MEKEFETRVLDINVSEISDKLRRLGAKEEPEVLQRRWVFDIDPCTVNSTGEWIRLRQVGSKQPTLTYKNKSGKGMSDTIESEVEVSDFDKTAAILSKLKFIGQYYQENKRVKFDYQEIEFTLDSWPMIPTFLEIEAKSKKKVAEGLKLLGLTGQDVGHLGNIPIYEKYGINIHSMKELKFK